MASLFLDTSNQVTFGLLDEDLEWLTFQILEDKKASKVLHSLIYEALTEYDLEIGELEQVFYLAGPGSYTGVRVAQGFAEVLRWQGMSTFSCRHFDVPKLLGHEKGVFVSKAFKEEAFLYKWEGENSEQKLIRESSALELIADLEADGNSCFTSEPENFSGSISTFELIEKSPSSLFGEMKKRGMLNDIFYYRSLEEEFSKGK